jgi:HK97 family phage major capsid protein
VKLNFSQSLHLVEAAEGEAPKRQIAGVAVPWNVEATVSDGTRTLFLPGSIPTDGPKPKLALDHDLGKIAGVVDALEDTGEELRFTAKVAATTLGDDTLELAAIGAYDQVSVGVEATDFEWKGSTLVVKAATLRELSLVPYGAYGERAHISSVAASAPDEEPTPTHTEGDSEVENTPEVVEAAAPATVPTVIHAAPRKAREISAAEYVSAVATGNTKILEAVAAEGVVADIPGVVPENLVGGVWDSLNDRRPLVTALGTLAMPQAGETFYRRKISAHTDVDVQAAEFDELASAKLEIDRVQIDKKTLGGYVDLSSQSIDFADVNMVALTLTDLGRVYAKKTEAEACAELITGATVTDDITDWADGDEILDKLFDASATIDAAIDELPTHILMGADRWALLGKAKLANGDRLFTQVGPSNVAGTISPSSFVVTGLGLTVVVSNKFAADSFVVGAPSMGMELYEDRRGALRVEQPATLSTRLAWYGYFAAKVLEAGAFVKFLDAE